MFCCGFFVIFRVPFVFFVFNYYLCVLLSCFCVANINVLFDMVDNFFDFFFDFFHFVSKKFKND